MRQKKIKNVLLLILFVIATLGAHAQSIQRVQHQYVEGCCISEMEGDEDEEYQAPSWAGWDLGPEWQEILVQRKAAWHAARTTQAQSQTTTFRTVNMFPIISTPILRITDNTFLIMDLNTGKNVLQIGDGCLR